VKRLDKLDNEKSFIHELEILASNSHPATLRLLGFGFDGDGLPMLVMDLMPNGSLENVFKAERRRRPPPEWDATRKSIAVFGICAAMAHLHSHNIIHRDLKPANVLLNDRWEPVVADFGLSRTFTPGLKLTVSPGTPLYMAPELCEDNDHYDQSVDVYAFAVLLYSFFAEPDEPDDGQGPFGSIVTTMHRVMQDTRFVKPPDIPEAYWALIQNAWDKAADKRPTFQEMVNDFHTNHDYIFPGADRAQVLEYENRILAANPPLEIEINPAELVEDDYQRMGPALGVSASGDLLRVSGGRSLSRTLPSGGISGSRRRDPFDWS
jgi:serine/threonine protein kinase